jgi:class 3 adenylate cyclase/pimeloyl-ACP methyl ester carboxylesterase
MTVQYILTPVPSPAWTTPRYARNGDTHIGFTTMGKGPPDLVQVGIALGHVEMWHEFAPNRRALERIASFCRLVDYDRRGSGISDRTVGAVPIEVEVEDLLAVMDAVGSDRPYLFGFGVGGSLSLVFAAVHPDRCAGVIAYSTPACFLRSDDYPYGWDERTFETFLQLIEDGGLAGPDAMPIIAPSMADDREYVEFSARVLRSATTPRQARDCFETYARTDIRNVLASVKVPVLVLHRTGDRLFPIDQSRDLAKRLPDARFVELPGIDWSPWVGDTDSLIAEIQAFVTGTRPAPEQDRQLATVLFTDVVKSTETVASIGDKRWRDLLDRHDDIVLREVERYGGRRVKTTGDGVLATFNGPAQGIRTALAIRDALASIGVPVRAGLHTGEIELRGDDIGGIAVHIGARVGSAANANEVLVSRTVKDLVAGSGITFADRGTQQLKGVAEDWQLFAVTST